MENLFHFSMILPQILQKIGRMAVQGLILKTMQDNMNMRMTLLWTRMQAFLKCPLMNFLCLRKNPIKLHCYHLWHRTIAPQRHLHGEREKELLLNYGANIQKFLQFHIIG
ncbi:hypothetical protein DsansV1_C30g0215381 [Dioscorea sansibarensis]